MDAAAIQAEREGVLEVIRRHLGHASAAPRARKRKPRTHNIGRPEAPDPDVHAPDDASERLGEFAWAADAAQAARAPTVRTSCASYASYGARAFRWPAATKQRAFGFFLTGRTAAHMIDAMRVVVKDDDGNEHRLTRSTVEGWIGGWYRSRRSQPVPIFPGAHAHTTTAVATAAALAAWNDAWHAATQAGASHLQPPYNVLTMDANPRSSGSTWYARAGGDPTRDGGGLGGGLGGLTGLDAEACSVLRLPTDRRPTYDEAKAALKKLVLKFHPDRENATLTQEERTRIFQTQYPAWTSAANRLFPGIAKTQFGFYSAGP